MDRESPRVVVSWIPSPRVARIDSTLLAALVSRPTTWERQRRTGGQTRRTLQDTRAFIPRPQQAEHDAETRPVALSFGNMTRSVCYMMRGFKGGTGRLTPWRMRRAKATRHAAVRRSEGFAWE